jgi:ABC-2 type transport system ATP-binding protein
MNGLTVSHLRKCYGDLTAVEDLDLQVRRGEIFGLIGPNGAGKSTSMMMIIGLLKPDSGTISFDDQPFDIRSSEMRSRFGLVPQNLAIYPELTAIQNLRFFGRLNGLSGQKLNERIDFVLHITGLRDKANHKVDTFSGGMARRLNFGVALVHEPEFVVLDEPTVGIDPQSRTNLLDGIRERKKRRAGVLYASPNSPSMSNRCRTTLQPNYVRSQKSRPIPRGRFASRSAIHYITETIPIISAASLRFWTRQASRWRM